jgi:hypothetical protein
MSYLLTDNMIELINKSLNIKLDIKERNFNLLIYVFENYDSINFDLISFEFYLLLKFIGHVDYFQVVDFIKYLTRKMINQNYVNLINPFINTNYNLLQSIIPNNLEDKLKDIKEMYISIINDRAEGIKDDYMYIWNKYYKNN